MFRKLMISNHDYTFIPKDNLLLLWSFSASVVSLLLPKNIW